MNAAHLRVVQDEPTTTEATDGPCWTWGPTPDTMRPAHREACIVVHHGTQDLPTIETGIRAVLSTPETRDPAWWRSRLPAVAFRMYWHPDGCDTSDGAESKQPLGAFDAHAVLTSVIVQKAQEVIIQTPHGSFPGVLNPNPDEKGRPIYSVALAFWMPTLNKAIAAFTGKPYEGPSMSKRRR